jgi:peptidoglycan/LPS O-acetylase OafA/YrhL
VLGAWLLPPLDLERLGQEALAALLFHSNLSYRDGGGYFVPTLDERWLLHTWSLSVEWQFYMVFPLLLAGVWWLTARAGPVAGAEARSRRAVGLALGFLVALSLALCIWKTATQAERAFFGLPFRAWEMGAGGLVYLAEPWLARRAGDWRRVLRLLALAALAVLLLAATLLDWEAHWPGAYAVGPVLASMLFLVAGSGPQSTSPAHSPTPAWLRWAPMQALGRWSYSVYLWHWPLVVALNLLRPDGDAPGWLTGAAMASSVLLGALSYRWVETRLQPRAAAAKRWAAVAVTAVLLGTATAAKATVSSEGWLVARTGAQAAHFRQLKALAAKDFYPKGCANFQRPRDALRTCTLNPGAPGAAVLVLGDSHAEHLYPWFAAHAAQRVDFLTSGGCPPIPGFNRREPGYHCDGFSSEAFARAGSGRYQVVVVAGNWDGGVDAQPPSLCRPGHPSCAQGARRADLMQATHTAWAALLRAGVTVVVMDQNPFAQHDVLALHMRRAFLGLPDSAGFVPRRPSGGSTRFAKEAVAALGAFPNLHLVSLRERFCDATGCQTLDPATGLPILVDSNHFSPDWMRRNGAPLAAFVRVQPPGAQ